jgi:hypothetical protein
VSWILDLSGWRTTTFSAAAEDDAVSASGGFSSSCVSVSRIALVRDHSNLSAEIAVFFTHDPSSGVADSRALNLRGIY